MNDKQAIDILMVDDDEGDLLMTREALEDSPYENSFHTAHDGMEALAFMEKKDAFSDAPTPDLILLDINMPRMNGHEVLQWMRQHKTYKRTPVIMLTTSASDHDILKSYESHANCYVTKPADLSQFNTVVQAIDSFWSNIAKLPTKS